MTQMAQIGRRPFARVAFPYVQFVDQAEQD